MGMLDVLKRWMGGGDKAAPVKHGPQMRPPAPRPVAAPLPKPVPPPIPAATAAAVAQPPAVQIPHPAPPSAAETLDGIAAKTSAKPAPISGERREKPRVNAREGTRVLVIDDSPTIVALLKRMLEQSGYTALEAMDAESGVALALSEEPDLIFLDIVLPGMNGFEALRRLRRDPISKTIPIIMISGNELATEQFYAQRIGADDFMKKPFSRNEVFARIEKLLNDEKVIRKHVVVASAGATAAIFAATATTTAIAPAVLAPPAAAIASNAASTPGMATPPAANVVVDAPPAKPVSAAVQQPITH